MVAVAMLGAVLRGRVRRTWVAERWWDGRRLDGNNAGVHDLTVDLHHHLITLRRIVETLCGGLRVLERRVCMRHLQGIQTHSNILHTHH